MVGYQLNDPTSLPLVNEHTNGISLFLIGNASSKGPFSIAMLDYRSVFPSNIEIKQELSNIFEVVMAHLFWFSFPSSVLVAIKPQPYA